MFAIGQLLGEIPYSILCAILYWVLMVRTLYPRTCSSLILSIGVPHGLRPWLCWIEWNWFPTNDDHLYGTFRCHVRSTNCFHISKCTGKPYNSLNVIDVTHVTQVAVLFNPFMGIVLSTFCGVTIPYPTMISFWRSWMYQLDPYTRTLSAMVSTELQ